MSVLASAWAWTIELSSTTKLVLLCLADFSNDDGVSYPSVKTIASKTGTSSKTVREHIAKLIKAKLLISEPVFASDGARTSNCYKLLIDTSRIKSFNLEHEQVEDLGDRVNITTPNIYNKNNIGIYIKDIIYGYVAKGKVGDRLISKFDNKIFTKEVTELYVNFKNLNLIFDLEKDKQLIKHIFTTAKDTKHFLRMIEVGERMEMVISYDKKTASWFRMNQYGRKSYYKNLRLVYKNWTRRLHEQGQGVKQPSDLSTERSIIPSE